MDKQNFYWGYVNWVGKLSNSINIGVSHINPNAEQKEHTHYGNEQFIFVSRGKGEYTCNDKIYILSEGEGLKFPLNAVHSTKNLLDTELVDISVSVPKKYIPAENLLTEDDSFKSIVDRICSVMDIDNLNIPIIIMDINDNIIYTNNSYDKIFNSNIRKTMSNKICIIEKQLDYKVSQLRCNDDFIVFSSKVLDDDIFIGEIRGGFYSYAINYDPNQIFSSSIVSIIEIINEISLSISKHIKFSHLSKKVNKLTSQLDKSSQVLADTQENLKLAKESTIDLKINQHFLFNALNYVASHAIEYDVNLYEMICDLGEMVRLTGKNVEKTLTIKEEMKFVENYIKFQGYRYGENLKYEINIPLNLLLIKIPSNIIQPLIENSFKHGFDNVGGIKELILEMRKTSSYIDITITNNGNILDINSLLRLNQGLKGEGAHSTNMIYSKLKVLYKDDFKFYYKTEEDSMICKLIIPLEERDDKSNSNR